MREWAARLYGDRSWPFQLGRYLSIGALVAGVDVASFALFLRAGWPLALAVTASYAIGVCSHFLLNKYANFRAHDRPLPHQAATYGIVAFACWLTTLLVVKLAVGAGIAPLGGKVMAIAVNVPLGFLGHRYLTFGRGVSAFVRDRIPGRRS